MSTPQWVGAAIGAVIALNIAFLGLRIWAVIRRERRR